MKNEKIARDTTMRTANIRVSAENVAKVDNEALGVKAGDIITYTKEDIINTLEEWSKTKHFDYYLIEHNDDAENKHYHIVINFADNSVCKFSVLKKKFPYGDIETCQHGVKNCVQYLVHMNNPEKYQYSWDDVVTNNSAQLELYKVPTRHTQDAKLNFIIHQILCGEIKEYEITQKIDSALYIRYGNRIAKAFEYANESAFIDTARDVQVYVLQGPARIGKSSFCKIWAKKHGKSIAFSSTGKHPFDEYRGQEVFVFDDYNHKQTSIQDMKKLLDPHSNAGVSARYHNKSFRDVDTIFICTNVPITEWYDKQPIEDREAIFKRISYVLDFKTISPDYISTYTVNEVTGDGILKPKDDCERKIDLKKYFNPSSDMDRKERFLEEIEAL